MTEKTKVLIGLEDVPGRRVRLHLSPQLTSSVKDKDSVAERIGKEIVSRLEKSELVLDQKEELAG